MERGGGRRAVVVCDQWLGSNGYAGMKALRRAGWSVDVVAEWEHVPVRWGSLPMRAAGRLLRPAAVREFNEALVKVVEHAKPEFLLVFKGTFVQRASLERIRSLGARTYCFYPDVSFRTHGRYLPAALPRYDWVFTTKSFGLADMREQLGVTRSSLLLHASDPDLHRPAALDDVDHARFGCDVSFIGTWSVRKEQMLAALVESRPGLHVKVWGNQWGRARAPQVVPCVAGRGVQGEDYVRAIVASEINLGLLSEARQGSSSGDRITSRTFHIPACGGFLLHERTREVLELFEEGSSIVCFTGTDELIERIDEYLPCPDERRCVAENGRLVVAGAHTWDHRIREILAVHERLK